jgi:hypothetical protein
VPRAVARPYGHEWRSVVVRGPARCLRTAVFFCIHVGVREHTRTCAPVSGRNLFGVGAGSSTTIPRRKALSKEPNGHDPKDESEARRDETLARYDAHPGIAMGMFGGVAA